MPRINSSQVTSQNFSLYVIPILKSPSAGVIVRIKRIYEFRVYENGIYLIEDVVSDNISNGFIDGNIFNTRYLESNEGYCFALIVKTRLEY